MHAGEVIVGRYRLDDEIGSGGMGIVWRAADRELDRVVAMKRAHPVDGAAGKAGNSQVRYEARIAAGLQHPNIVTVYDVVNDGDDRWLVMEYVPSRSLAEILAEKHTLPPAQVAHLGAQIAAALAESATQTAVGVLNASGVPRRTTPPDPHSLATVDACKLLDATALAAVPGVEANQADASTPMQIGSRPAFLEPGADGPGTCSVEIEHRTYTSTNEDQLAEIVRVTVAGSGVQSQLCGTATQLGSSVVAHLPAAS